jgi:hypothetical protein
MPSRVALRARCRVFRRGTGRCVGVYP